MHLYKIFASMLKQRTLDAGADGRLWSSQFGFRAKRCTEDAIYVARRRIELACAQRGGSITLLALDWQKAFDRVNVQSLLWALRRFGLPKSIINMVSGLMLDRQFFVEDLGIAPSTSSQRSSISQGCTLSMLLFIILMTVMMQDAVVLLSPQA